MKKIFYYLKNIKNIFSKIHLVDKCLILFMIVLMTQSAYNLFSCDKSTNESNTIDIIVRTSTAAIFGYFLSGNFIRNSSTKSSKSSNKASAKPNNLLGVVSPDTPMASIGFSDSSKRLSVNSQIGEGVNINSANMQNSNQDVKPYASSKLQIVVATVIGLFCLISLIVLKNITDWNADTTSNTSIAATVAQFRDFVSGCVGFLIGSPTNEGGNGNSDSED